MKKILTLLVIGFILTLVLGAFVGFKKHDETPLEKSSYVRIHIRANSNDEVDQRVKLKVKEAVVEFLTPFIASCNTLEQAHAVIRSHLSGVTRVADAVLAQEGFEYTSRARMTDEYFPTRAYGELVLDEGVYDALIVELGSGTGDNWWCVVYPPLCFIGAESNGSNSITYKSKILEIINKLCK